MANKAISELPQAQNVNNQDLFVLEQSGIAKKLTAETFITEQGIIDALAEALDGHGGIQSVTLSSVSGRIRTYLITFTDQSATTFQVLDGASIDRITKTSTAGLVDTYTIFMSDGTTSFFQVTNGGYGLDRTLTMSNAAAPADLVGDLKSAIETKIGFVNEASAHLFDPVVSTSSAYLANTRRWFVNHIFHSGDVIDSIDYQFWKGSAVQGRIINFEIWEKSGNILNKVETVSADVSQAVAESAVGAGTIDINYTATTDCMIAVQQEENPPCLLYQPDNTGADNVLMSTNVDKNASELSFSSLEPFGIKLIPSFTIHYRTQTKVNVVQIGDGMDYAEIQDALIGITDDSATNPYTLIVMPKGTPYKPFSMLRNSFSDPYPWSGISPRYISIIGVDKAHCVIRSDSGNYKLPCGELMTNGIVKNLKFVMTNDSQDPAATQGGYCLHIDCRTKDDVGYNMTVEDCEFEDASGPCLGIGMHKNCTLTIRRCNFHTTLAANYSPHEGYTSLVNYGVIFCHSSTLADSTNQKISIEDCTGLCEEGNKGLWLATAGDYDPSTASFYYRLLRNVFWNKTQDSPSYSISSTLTADPMNFGNNIP